MRYQRYNIYHTLDTYNLTPKQACHKCSAHSWYTDLDELTWACPICGNLAYYINGSFRQQIDMIMESSRGSEYVRDKSGCAVLPKKNEEVRKFKFAEALEKERMYNPELLET